jgi:protein-S-isoprenylcysteine O-methyltransferase Ste14
MNALRTIIPVVWLVFWIYWLSAAVTAKASVSTGRVRLPGLSFLVVGFLLLHVFKVSGAVVHNPVVQVIGTVLFLAGLGLAVWARLYLGRNWGMPMTQRAEPELVTSGPYTYVRHPIYSGILLAMIGTGLATNLVWLIAAAAIAIYFLYSATVEERNLAATFPTSYPGYRTRTKMIVPFVL